MPRTNDRWIWSRGKMLDGHRFDDDSNKAYTMPADIFHNNFDNSDAGLIAQVVEKFLAHHYQYEAPRIAELQRYYLGDNDIHYWRNDKKYLNRADNRVASGFPKFITNMRVGYMMGKPIKMQWSDDSETKPAIVDAVEEFNRANDETYHEKVMKTNLSVTGRAYELMYTEQPTKNEDGSFNTAKVKMKAVDPLTAFVVYDTSIEEKPLFGVRYYLVDYDDAGTQGYYVDVYTADTIYHYYAGENPTNADMKLVGTDNSGFGVEPLTEYANNEDRTGDWESKLDEIDAYDKALSEMANSEEDFANAKFVINGDIDADMEAIMGPDGKPLLDDDGNPMMVPKIDAKDPYLFIKPSIIPDANGNTVVPASAEYRTKQMNEAGWKLYIERLAADIHKDTNTPDTSDQNFGGNNSGVAMAYKLFGQDQEMSMQKSLFSRGVMRRLRMLNYYWYQNGEAGINQDDADNFKINYTPNLPNNDSEIVQELQTLSNTGLFSERTLREFGASVTGVSADAEEQRIDDERANEQQGQFDPTALQGVNSADLEEANRKALQNLQQQGQQPPMSPTDFLMNAQRSDNNAK